MSGTPTPLGPGAEFDRLRAVFRQMGPRLRHAGDDAALVTIEGLQLAFSCDLSVEDRHFRASWLAAEEIGWRACAAALSDLAAVAAEPLGVLAAVGVPAGRDGAFLEQLMVGIGTAAEQAGAVVWGGDLVRASHVTVDITVVGRAAQPVRRSGAHPGDSVWVTGALGGPHAAVAAWTAGQEPAAALRERFAHPVPRIRESWWLRDRGATAMIDVSDGLVGDAGHVAAASGVGVEIEVEQVPVHPAGASGAASTAGTADEADRALVGALVGGEEYELLVAMPAGFGNAEARMFAAQFGIPLTRVGAVVAGEGVRVRRGGKPFDVPGGFSHF